MSYPSDREAYLKGYEDAMRAAGAPGPTSADTGTGKRRGARPTGSGMGAKIQEGIGTAFGWLILFPVFVGLVAGSFGWLLGGEFAIPAKLFGGLALLFALFAGAVLVGWRLFLALWPVVIVALIVVVIVVRLLG